MLQGTGNLPLKILKNGAIIFRNLSMDGCGDKKYRIVTHAHADHYKHVITSSKKALKVIATPETFAILDGLNIIVPRNKRYELNIDGKIMLDDSTNVEFLKSEHIPGSVSPVVTTDDLVIGYTGDFKLEGTEIISKPDILVVDATYGSPNHIRSWNNNDVLDEIISLYKQSKGRLWLYGYYGKIQGVLLKLRDLGFDEPVIMTSKMYKITRNLSKIISGRFGEFSLLGTKEARDLLRDKVIVMDHATSFYRYKSSRVGMHVLLNGWEFRKPIMQVDQRSYIASYSDHSDYIGTLRYVEESKPKTVIVDSSRSEYAGFFAYILRRKLGINAIAMPI
ncbi:MAG: MBL fold metallo-hydrolase [Desulfurococcales archaeon]|nr:MBL fold metallo-hydrolase [Desulfurococcales archaeon]